MRTFLLQRSTRTLIKKKILTSYSLWHLKGVSPLDSVTPYQKLPLAWGVGVHSWFIQFKALCLSRWNHRCFMKDLSHPTSKFLSSINLRYILQLSTLLLSWIGQKSWTTSLQPLHRSQTKWCWFKINSRIATYKSGSSPLLLSQHATKAGPKKRTRKIPYLARRWAKWLIRSSQPPPSATDSPCCIQRISYNAGKTFV